jgi:hypothetical protein
VSKDNRLISVYHFPHGALTHCPQLCMGILPRRYKEIGLFEQFLAGPATSARRVRSAERSTCAACSANMSA